MKRPNYLQQIRKRINEADHGSVFIPSDFFDIAPAAQVNMGLNRLKNTGEVIAIKRGIYSKPRHSILLNENIPPRSDDIAKAIARNYGWAIVPSGETALNMLGLSTQVPAVWEYVSNGPYKAYDIDGVKLRFKRTNKKNEILDISYRTAVIIQALRSMGKQHISPNTIKKLANLLTAEDKKLLLAEGRRATAWIYDCIRKICAEEKNA